MGWILQWAEAPSPIMACIWKSYNTASAEAVTKVPRAQGRGLRTHHSMGGVPKSCHKKSMWDGISFHPSFENMFCHTPPPAYFINQGEGGSALNLSDLTQQSLPSLLQSIEVGSCRLAALLHVGNKGSWLLLLYDTGILNLYL